MDFTSTELATAALINPRNHTLNGRKLIMEYASADAVRRGGGPGAREKRLGKGGGNKSTMKNRAAGAERQDTNDHGDDAKDVQERGQAEGGYAGRKSWREGDRESRHRPRPGAALALAKRESTAIVPSEGTRIKFT